MQKTRFLNQRLTRWLLYLQNFDIKFEYIKGSENKLADYASRADITKEDGNLETMIAMGVVKQETHFESKMRNIHVFQKKDGRNLEILRKVEKTPVKNYRVIDNVLYKNDRVVVPAELIEKLIDYVHSFYGHFGADKCVRMLQEKFSFKKMRHRVAKIVRTCDVCQRCKYDTTGNYAPMQTVAPKKPGELLSIDYAGPLPASKFGMKFILTAMDVFSKFLITYPVKNSTTSVTITKLKNYFEKFGKPQKVQMDNAKNFISDKLKDFLKENGVQWVYSSVERPQGNLVERPHREMNRLFRTYMGKKHTEWNDLLPFVQDCINNASHDTTGYTPIEIFLNKKPPRFWDSFYKNQIHDDVSYEEKIKVVGTRSIENGKARAEKFNKLHKFKTYNVGDKVLLKTTNLSNASKKLKSKFMPVYNGPFILSAKAGEHSFLLTGLNGKIRGKFHSAAFKLYHERDEEDQAQDEETGQTDKEKRKGIEESVAE